MSIDAKRRSTLALALIVIGTGVGCAGDEPAVVHQEQALSALPECVGAPAAAVGATARAFVERPAEVYLIPAHPRPGDQVFVAVRTNTYPVVAPVVARLTSDGWATAADVALDSWCERDSYIYHGVELGSYSEPTTIELALRLHEVYPVWERDVWLDNGGANYQIEVARAPELAWVGDTHLRVDEHYIPSELTPANRDLEVYTQTYPVAAAQRVELFWADEDYASIQSVAMTGDAEWVGDNGNNAQWKATIPAGDMNAGRAVHYWIRADDSAGNVLWDAGDGANYTVVPRSFDVVWVGGLGNYRPSSDAYREGGNFNDDDSTSTGCNNHGASISSFSARAVRVYVPGLTDRDFGDGELEGAARLLRVELYTDASVDGWTAMPARFARVQGNDFIYRFQWVRFGPPSCIPGLAAGNYGFKIRVSGDGGETWFWRGSEDGPAGGDDLVVQYSGGCSYFNNPFSCLPTTTDITSRLGGRAANVRLDAASTGAVVTHTRTLSSSSLRTLGELELVGADADLFALALFDDATGAALELSVSHEIGPDRALRLEVSYAPTRANRGALPHQADVHWREVQTTPYAMETAATGMYLRGVVAP